MSVISMKQLLEAGVHFGHQTRRWNPKMAPYIFTERNGIYIIDLQKTVKKAEEAYNFIREVSEAGKDVIFVGTKKQAQEAVKEEAERSNMYFVNHRWLGGMLTNFTTIKTRINRLNKLDEMEQDGTFDVLPKKEVAEVLPSTVPLDRIVVETDSPYMAPVPYRGKRNESAFAVEVVRKLADIYCTTEEEIGRITTDNVHRIFFRS